MTKQEQIQKEADEYVSRIESDFKSRLTFGERVADKVSNFVGSWKFIWWTSGFLAVWITFNSLELLKVIRVDPYPFVLLNLMLSFIAAFQSQLILLSTNRSSVRDRYYANLDFKQDYITSREQNEMHDHMDEIVESTREIKEVYPMIKDIHQYITENGWNNK